MSLGRRRPLGLLLGIVVALVTLAVVARATLFSNDSGSAPEAGAKPGDSGSFVTARDGVCAAAGQVRQHDVSGARVVFFDRVHQPLHGLATLSARSDRAAAARLLEAKQQVESGFDDGAPSLAQDLDALAGATRSAIVASGLPDPGPCPIRNAGG